MPKKSQIIEYSDFCTLECKELQAQTFSLATQGREKVFASIQTIKLRVVQERVTYAWWDCAMYKKTHMK